MVKFAGCFALCGSKFSTTSQIAPSLPLPGMPGPVGALVPPGQCVFGDEFTPAVLHHKEEVSADTKIFTFSLPDPSSPLMLSTCACILAKGGINGDVIRPYTPISTNALLGQFQLLIKVYPDGAFSKWIDGIDVGTSVQFKHTAKNVKIQYPFGKKRIGMICGGTGITPMVQALHAILGCPSDCTQVNMLYGSKSRGDILLRPLLDAWAGTTGTTGTTGSGGGSASRLKCTHILSRETEADSTAVPIPDGTSEGGHIDRARVLRHMPPPSMGDDCCIFVCGPPGMTEAICGPRNEPLKEGSILHELGYSDEQVIKF